MISADVKAREKKQEIKKTRDKGTGSCIFYFFISTFKILNTLYQQTCIFHLILHGIPSSLVLYCPLRTGVGGLFNRQNPLSVTKVICQRSLTEKDLFFN